VNLLAANGLYTIKQWGFTNMNGYSIYLKTNGQYGIDRTLEGIQLYSVKGQWTTKEGAIKKVYKLYSLET
jgi:hypothetical protein